MKALMQDKYGDVLVEDHKLHLIDGKDKAYQSWVNRLKTVRGGWPMDISRGMPYQEKIFRKGTSRAELEQIYRNESLKVAEIDRITKIIIEGPDANREGTVLIEAQSDEGWSETLRYYGQEYDVSQKRIIASGGSDSSSIVTVTVV